MKLSNDIKAIVLLFLLLLGAFAAGRYSALSTEVKKTEVDTSKTTDDKNKVVTIVTDKKPDGEVITTKTSTTVEKIVKTTDDTIKSDTTINASRSRINVSLLMAEDLTNLGRPTYGLAVSKEFIGPVTLGAFGLTNGIVGLSVGLDF